jgi:hypothetical protein
VDAEVLARSGISESLIARTIHALKTLDLIDDEGKPTETLEGLRLAPEGEYVNRLGQWLNSAYADVLKFIDPSTADETALRDAFRSYTPVGQQPRMVSLFVGLYGAAGIGPEKGAPPRSTRRSRAAPPSATPNGTNGSKRTIPVSSGSEVAEHTAPPSAPPPPTPAPMSDKALEYKLVDLLKNDDIEDNQRSAIWTLIQYLAAKSRPPTRPREMPE